MKDLPVGGEFMNEYANTQRINHFNLALHTTSGEFRLLGTMDYVRNDLKGMKLIEWTGQVQDRLKWKGIVEKAKTLPEL
jgi:tRNA A37 threonylcarbamoyladenosine biosynthesis protein TsaE